MPEAFRAFVAVDVGPLPGVVSLMDGLRATGADLKIVDPVNLHLTVKFIGNLDPERVDDVVATLRDAATEAAPFHADLEGVGAFGSRKSPRVVFVKLRHGERLAPVANAIDARLAELDLAKRESRGFKAHVTIARSRSPRGGSEVAKFVQAHEHAHAGAIDVTHLRLMRSDLTPEGPRYTEVARVPLGGE